MATALLLFVMRNNEERREREREIEGEIISPDGRTNARSAARGGTNFSD